MTRERVIERVRKLLALSNSSNEHEAALAAAHAQRLLAEHNLAISELEMREEGAGEAELYVAKTVPKWLSSLFAVVANAFDCMAILATTVNAGRLRFIGVGEDPAVAACTMQFLMQELRRLASRYLKQQERGQTCLPRQSAAGYATPTCWAVCRGYSRPWRSRRQRPRLLPERWCRSRMR